MSSDTVAAIATPAGVGGVGIVRISGPAATAIAHILTGGLPAPGTFRFSRFRDADDTTIDEGVVLFFEGPHSFTGEDVVELQGHGGPVVMDLLLRRVLSLGVRMARPGEFSERAFLNGKIDLVQAEAIADLIDAGSADAARSATRSLEGEFSRQVNQLVEAITKLRMYCEAAIDFPEEEIDFLQDTKISEDLLTIEAAIQKIFDGVRTGVVLREGMRLVIAGRPNAGKSSLLNALARRESAIVTEVPGTTRDLLREQIQIDGMPIHLVDTAGLRDTTDRVEREGIDRARREIAKADLILWVYDARESNVQADLVNAALPAEIPVTLVRNKIDLVDGTAPGGESRDRISISAKQDLGMDELREHLKSRMGYEGPREGSFSARRRHLDALDRAAGSVEAARRALEKDRSGELMAEDLRHAQMALGEITGKVTADDLLGQIFSSFCIGK